MRVSVNGDRRWGGGMHPSWRRRRRTFGGDGPMLIAMVVAAFVLAIALGVIVSWRTTSHG